MARTIETRVLLTGKITPSMIKAFTSMQNHLDKTSKKADTLNRLTSKLGGKLAMGIGLLGGSIAGAEIGKAALDSASSMEAYRATLNVVMKDSEKAAKAMKWAVDFANRTPFETDSVVQATVLLESYGLKAQKILPSVGNMAGVMNKDIIQAVEAVADAQTGELERLKEFCITKGQIVQKAEALFKKQEVVNKQGQIMDQEKFNQALFALMDDRFKGGMEIQARGWKGIMSTITGVYKSGLAKIMGMTDEGDIKKGSAFDILKIKAQDLADYLQKLYNSGELDRIGEGIASGLETTFKVLGAIERAGPVVIPILAGMTAGTIAYTTATKGAMIITALSKAWEYGTTVMALMRTGTSLAAIAQMELNLAMSANPIGLVVLAIGAAVAAGVALYQNWDWVKLKAIELWQTAEKYMPFLKYIAGPIGLAVDAGRLLIQNWDAIMAKGQQMWEKVQKYVAPIAKVFQGSAANIPYQSARDKDQPYRKFASGGFASRAAIFGEAGLEAAIPIKRRNPRSLALLNQTARMLGVDSGGGSAQFTFAPNIYGGNAQEIGPMLNRAMEDFEMRMSRFMVEQKRVSFGA